MTREGEDVDLTPPFGGDRPPGEHTCGYGTRESHCGRPATWHILWTVDGDNSLDCDEHMAHAQTRWVYFARHPLSPECTLRGARFHENRCAVPDEPRAFHLTRRKDAPPWMVPPGLAR